MKEKNKRDREGERVRETERERVEGGNAASVPSSLKIYMFPGFIAQGKGWSLISFHPSFNTLISRFGTGTSQRDVLSHKGPF